QVTLLSGSGVTSTGDLTISSSMTWSGGRYFGPGKLIISPTATLDISGGDSKGLNGTLEVAGTATYSGQSFLYGWSSQTPGASIHVLAGGSFAVTGEGDFQDWASVGGHSFINEGTFTKSGVGTTTQFTNGVAFNNSGTVKLQEGTLQLLGGGSDNQPVALPSGTTLSLGSNFSF